MKKIIQLTESDLTNIVNKVIKESATKNYLIDIIKEESWDSAADLVGGIENLKKLTGINTATDFLNLFNDMNVVKSDENPQWTLFYYDPKRTMVSYNRKNKKVWVNYRDIWIILENDFEMINKSDSEIKEFITKWLVEVYKINPSEVKRGKAVYQYLTDGY
jgi:hypothetical protein